MKSIFPVCILGLSVLLSGCGQTEPTEAEINNTLKTSFEEANAQISKSAGAAGAKLLDSMKVKFISARKISCEASGTKNKYNCTVEIESEAPMVGPQKVTTSLPFIKDGDKWIVVMPAQ
ncbi:hypothetical protein RCO01_09320 [Escherichia coli]|uniref:hypothetical protein n=1 Tax=Escherichia TaxID=561 RepID=UPI000BE59603|nr:MULTISPECIES: hypothetical protein [Escherichia]EFH6731687.1 hypothetical protein [Escherichia coli]EFU2692320.1 hypothetical protein [Escherichia coli]EGH1319187.1 hypothetical protein [Escherichia coli]EGH1342514.1 hypothetical protein [Escherichia coli]EGI9629658.1 hypothetical protein [Escherichia coli]